MLEHKLIICSPYNFETVSEKFPSKKVIADIHCDNTFAIYIRKYPKGIFNIRVSDWTIWKPFSFPYFKKWK
jgi:hypothetical protein